MQPEVASSQKTVFFKADQVGKALLDHVLDTQLAQVQVFHRGTTQKLEAQHRKEIGAAGRTIINISLAVELGGWNHWNDLR